MDLNVKQITEEGMNKKWYRTIRGLSVVSALLCALMTGITSISSVTAYKSMIDGFIGGSAASAGSAEAYAFKSDYESTTEMLTERRRIAEQLSEEGCVLLKNNDTGLPLTAEEKNVTVLGSRAYTYKSDGTRRDVADGSGSISFYGGITGSRIYETSVTTEDGTTKLPVTVEDAFANQGLNVNPALKEYYSNQPFPNMPAGGEASGDAGVGNSQFAIGEPSISAANAGNYGEYNDACFVVIGRASGEGRDYNPGQRGITGTDGAASALNLSNEERNLINVANEISDKVIVLLNSAIPMEIDELKEGELAAKVDSILWIGLPGSYGMNGVARVITGQSSPSGHLPDTYAVDASASPAAQNFGRGDMTSATAPTFTWSNAGSYTKAYNGHYVVMAENIYTGYFYYETRYADSVLGQGDAASATGKGRGSSDVWRYQDEITYTFGYGQSYATFEQKILPETFTVDYANKTVSVDVEVRNTSSTPAKSVVQLYMQSPYTDYDRAHGVEKSAVQLVAFEKTDTLSPDNPVQTVTLTVDMKYLASYDNTVQHDGVTGGWILEDADYYFAIGNGAHEALNNILVKQNPANAENEYFYSEEGATVNPDNAVVWRPQSGEEGIGDFTDGVNATFLSTTESGTIVSNQLANADYNYFNPGKVTYLTRNNWSGTFPRIYTGLQRTDTMTDYLDANVYKWANGRADVEFGVDHSLEYDEDGNELENMSIAEMKLASFEDERWDYILPQITLDEAWYFSPDGGARCRAFESVNAPEVWQIDGPNGCINRTLGARAPSSGTMAIPNSDPNYGYFSNDMCCQPMTAATFNKQLINEQGKIYGEDLLWNRSPIMWAPGMNLHRVPFNSRNHEYYSEDAMLTNLCGVAFINGGLEKGAILAAKHFAFNTQETYREGLAQFFLEQPGREMELRAFQGAIEDTEYVNANGNTIRSLGLMSSFSRVGVCDGNSHTGMMKNILRGEWGFKGLISTDYVSGDYYFNPRDSVINNVTFMAYGTYNPANNWTDYNAKSVSSDPNMMQALYDNMHYYMYSIANSSALNGIDADTVIDADAMAWWQIMFICLAAVFGVAAAGGVAFICLSDARQNKKQLCKADGAENSDDNGEVTK